MKRPPKEWIAARLADLAKQFPPTPARYAEITFTLTEVEMVPLTVRMMKPRLAALRKLFDGMSDDAIVNAMVEDLFDRLGVIE